MSDSDEDKLIRRTAAPRIHDAGAMLEKGSDFPVSLRRIYTAMGIALHNWNSVEDALYKLFCVLVRPDNVPAISAAYYSIINFNTKLSMIHSTAQVSMSEENKTKWNKIYNKTNRLGKTRNKIAHYTLIVDLIEPEDIEDDNNNNDETRLDIYLRPGIHNVLAGLEDMKGSLSKLRYRDIETASDNFAKHAVTIERFRQSLPVPPTSPRKAPPQEDHPHQGPPHKDDQSSTNT